MSNVSQWNFIEYLVIARLGVSILPEHIAKMLKDEIKSIKLKTRYELGTWSNLEKDKLLSYATSKWIKFMTERLENK